MKRCAKLLWNKCFFHFVHSILPYSIIHLSLHPIFLYSSISSSIHHSIHILPCPSHIHSILIFHFIHSIYPSACHQLNITPFIQYPMDTRLLDYFIYPSNESLLSTHTQITYIPFFQFKQFHAIKSINRYKI